MDKNRDECTPMDVDLSRSHIHEDSSLMDISYETARMENSNDRTLSPFVGDSTFSIVPEDNTSSLEKVPSQNTLDAHSVISNTPTVETVPPVTSLSVPTINFIAVTPEAKNKEEAEPSCEESENSKSLKSTNVNKQLFINSEVNLPSLEDLGIIDVATSSDFFDAEEDSGANKAASILPCNVLAAHSSEDDSQSYDLIDTSIVKNPKKEDSRSEDDQPSSIDKTLTSVSPFVKGIGSDMNSDSESNDNIQSSSVALEESKHFNVAICDTGDESNLKDNDQWSAVDKPINCRQSGVNIVTQEESKSLNAALCVTGDVSKSIDINESSPTEITLGTVIGSTDVGLLIDTNHTSEVMIPVNEAIVTIHGMSPMEFINIRKTPEKYADMHKIIVDATVPVKSEIGPKEEEKPCQISSTKITSEPAIVPTDVGLLIDTNQTEEVKIRTSDTSAMNPINETIDGMSPMEFINIRNTPEKSAVTPKILVDTTLPVESEIVRKEEEKPFQISSTKITSEPAIVPTDVGLLIDTNKTEEVKIQTSDTSATNPINETIDGMSPMEFINIRNTPEKSAVTPKILVDTTLPVESEIGPKAEEKPCQTSSIEVTIEPAAVPKDEGLLIDTNQTSEVSAMNPVNETSVTVKEISVMELINIKNTPEKSAVGPKIVDATVLATSEIDTKKEVESSMVAKKTKIVPKKLENVSPSVSNQALLDLVTLKTDNIPQSKKNAMERTENKENCMKEGGKPKNQVKDENVNETLQVSNRLNIDNSNMPIYDFSMFSDSPAKSTRRETLFRLFDPLYDADSDATIIQESSKPEENTPAATMDEEVCNLKLELNQIRQEKSALELECHQKDEIILKAQAEWQKKEAALKSEIAEMQEKLLSIDENSNNHEIKNLKEELTDVKTCKMQLTEKNNLQAKELSDLKKTLNDYLEFFNKMTKEAEEYKVDFNTTKQHLAATEMAFNDVHLKYERTKEIIFGYKSNEQVLLTNLEQANACAKKNEERYNSLKAHAKAQLDKANKELALMKEKHHAEITKLSTLMRRLEIKNGSIQQSLDQKAKECSDLAALCDELTGSIKR